MIVTSATRHRSLAGGVMLGDFREDRVADGLRLARRERDEAGIQRLSLERPRSSPADEEDLLTQGPDPEEVPSRPHAQPQ